MNNHCDLCSFACVFLLYLCFSRLEDDGESLLRETAGLSMFGSQGTLESGALFSFVWKNVNIGVLASSSCLCVMMNR